MRHQLKPNFCPAAKIEINLLSQLIRKALCVQTQLEKCCYFGATIIVVTVEVILSKGQKVKEMGKMANNDYDIQELLQRDVYVNDTKVGE